MSFDKYKYFTKYKDALYLDFFVNYNKKQLNFIIFFKGIFIKNNTKNNFDAKIIIILDIDLKNQIYIKSYDIT